MLSIKVLVKNLDYDSLIKLGLPILRANPPDFDTKKLINKAIKKSLDMLLKVDESKFMSAVETIPTSIKRYLAIIIISKSHSKIEAFIKSFTESHNLVLEVSNIFIEKEDNSSSDTLLIGCDVIELGYSSFIKKFLPTIHFDDNGNEMNLFLNALFPALISEYSSIERIINSIDNIILEKFIIYLINQNKEKILQLLTAGINEKGISLVVDALIIKHLNKE